VPTGGRRARQPQTARAERIARSLYRCVAAVEWVPSDEADVFRLTFSSELEPRYLKLPIQGIGAVWREVMLLPALRARGFPVLEFEHRTGDLPDAGIEFHITREVQHVAGAGLVAADPPRRPPARHPARPDRPAAGGAGCPGDSRLRAMESPPVRVVEAAVPGLDR